MNILVVGNIIKDVYLNLDSRTEQFETDKHGVKWLDLAFNASEHHFFSRNSSLGGAAVTLEVLQKLGLKASISGSHLNFNHDDPIISTTNTIDDTFNYNDTTCRYILVNDSQVTYFAPSNFTKTSFIPPEQPIDYLYLDRSAEISHPVSQDILNHLDHNPHVKLVIYLRNLDNPAMNSLIPHASLIFMENDTPSQQNSLYLDSTKLVKISESRLSYANITEPISINRVDVLTHLSAYSIASATILGNFILGQSVEDSLKLARINVEHSRLNSSLTLSDLQELATTHTPSESLELVAANLVLAPKGILAADESGGSIHKKFAELNIPDTYDNRRDYRNIFFTTPDLMHHVNGVILFDETARQLADNGQKFVDFLTSKRIIPGIKVDQGLEKIDGSQETYTKGLDGLPERLREYYQMGLRFAKWRAAFEIRTDIDGNIITPTDEAITKNCQILAEYAKECQTAHIVPIVEPELVYDGNYDIDQSTRITGHILDLLFQELAHRHVNLRACILKCNMVLAGKQQETQSSPEEVGIATAKVLKDHVPSDLAGVVFLSGGQTPEQATDNLAAIIKNGPFPWPVTFSFARALQDPALFAWQGDNHNAASAQTAFSERLAANTQILKNNPS